MFKDHELSALIKKQIEKVNEECNESEEKNLIEDVENLVKEIKEINFVLLEIFSDDGLFCQSDLKRYLKNNFVEKKIMEYKKRINNLQSLLKKGDEKIENKNFPAKLWGELKETIEYYNKKIILWSDKLNEKDLIEKIIYKTKERLDEEILKI